MLTRVCVLMAVSVVALAPGARAEEPKREADPKPPTYKAPKGWASEKDKSGFATARFRAGEGERAVSMVLLGSSGTGGGVVANVNRWRAQVGLQALDAESVERAVEKVKVDGRDAYLVDATGPEDAGAGARRVVAVIVPRDDGTWFFRMSGPAKEVGGQKKAFDEFVKSLRFEK